jgi:hypothetical protein
MPVISRFLGIIIMMFYKDHNPPHFHIKYNEYRGVFSINELKLIEGELPKRVISIILEWANEHRNDLLNDWEKAKNKEELINIEPLI